MGGRAHRRTGGRTCGYADGGGQWTDGRGDGRTGRRTGGRVGGLADGRTGEQRISEGKTPDLTRQLTWPWEIQHGHP